jgi:hypothetical protein
MMIRTPAASRQPPAAGAHFVTSLTDGAVSALFYSICLSVFYYLLLFLFLAAAGFHCAIARFSCSFVFVNISYLYIVLYLFYLITLLKKRVCN